MAFTSYFEAFLFTITLAIGTQVVYNFLKNGRKEIVSEKKERKEIHEVIMFSYTIGELKRSKYSRCMITESMERILHYLSSSRHTLDICMYVFTNVDIANVLLKMHFKGVKIRIILDADMAFSSGSVVKKLQKQSIPVRWIKSTNLMHHKFTLIDASCDELHGGVIPMVMMGSLNWTNQALSGNWEDVAVTSQEMLVKQYKDEFERLWTTFKIVDL